MGKYIGITIGPIFETIYDASTPAALWFGSTLFSDITRRLCVEFDKYKENGVTIFSPAYDPADKEKLSDGIGKYHDRMIIHMEQENVIPKEKLDEIVKKVKDETFELFGDSLSNNNTADYQTCLTEYLQINYVIVDEAKIGNKNCLLAMSPYLDAMDCMKTFSGVIIDNPIAEVMERHAKDKSNSSLIKKTKLFTDVALHLTAEHNNKIRDLKSIAAYEKKNADLKYTNYFAVVSADADYTGKYLETLTEKDQITLFSEMCLAYSKEAAKKIEEFGGMTIYAGGDDLLFIAPVKGANGEIVFELCKRINEVFTKKIEEIGNHTTINPTISFGISIQYIKSPLYEALANSRKLLEMSKDFSGKNCMSIDLKKHSGQSLALQFKNTKVDVINEFLGLLDLADTNTIKSVGTKLELMYSLITVIDRQKKSGQEVNTSWENIFDNEGQKSAEKYIREINRLYYTELMNERDEIISNEVFEEERNNTALNSLITILRLSKFMKEKSGEED